MAKSSKKKNKNLPKQKARQRESKQFVATPLEPSQPATATSEDEARDKGTELALNLADIGHELNLAAHVPGEFRARLAALADDAAARFGRTTIDRIYVGSYFCDRFFLSLNWDFFSGILAACRDWSLSATLVVPIFGQGPLEAGKKRIEQLLAYGDERGLLFDEAVANDPAMAITLGAIGDRRDGGLHLAYGRMMAKTSRDPRHQVIEAAPQPYALDEAQAASLRAQFGYVLAECDPTAPQVDATALANALPLALHLPHCFMTTGHICEAASMDTPVDHKFRADMPCHQQCLSGVQVYEHKNYDTGEPRWFTRQGRTVLFENPDVELIGAQPQRFVWTPADFVCGTADAPEPGPGFFAPWPTMQEGGASWE